MASASDRDKESVYSSACRVLAGSLNRRCRPHSRPRCTASWSTAILIDVTRNLCLRKS